MSDNTTDFFDNIGSGAGSPTALLKNPGDFVHGEIVEMFKRDYVPFGKKDPEVDESEADGKRKQLVIVIQTTNRNWANVVKVPKVDPNDPNSAEKAPEEDDGKRSVYVPNRSNIQWAIGRAVSAAKAKFEVGATLGVRIEKLTDTGKGNPLKEHGAVYVPRTAGDGFFPQAETPAAPEAQAPAADPAPAQQAYAAGSSFGGGDHGLQAQPAAPAAAPAQDPWASSAPAAPAAGDPWGSAPATSEPPF